MDGISNPQQEPPQKLTPEMKDRWNHFVQFVAAQRLANMNVLDQKNKNIGMGLMQKFNMANPDKAIPLDIVPKVQGELQDYRNGVVQQWKENPATVPGIKDESEIMNGISPIDGWPGSKTLSSRFPVAMLTTNKGGDIAKQNFGTDIDSYNNAIAKKHL